MKQTLYKNISLLRIPIKAGVSEYYFPQNVNWADKIVERIVVCIPKTACLDPMDGTTNVLTTSDYTDLYFDITSSDQKELMHAVSAEQILHINNNPIMLNSKLDLRLCRLYFTTAPAADYTLLLYVYYENREGETNDLPENSITVEFPLAAREEINLQQLITTYIHALPSKVKGVLFWNAITAPAYFTLRDYKLTYILQDLHSELARPNMNNGAAYNSQVAPMLFDNIDINFQYSHIRNAENQANTQKITFLY